MQFVPTSLKHHVDMDVDTTRALFMIESFGQWPIRDLMNKYVKPRIASF